MNLLGSLHVSSGVQNCVFWCRVINVMLSDVVQVVNGIVKQILGTNEFLVRVDSNHPLVFLAIGQQEDCSNVIGKTYYCRNIVVEFHRIHYLGLYDWCITVDGNENQ
jgi:hypothetical protein